MFRDHWDERSANKVSLTLMDKVTFLDAREKKKNQEENRQESEGLASGGQPPPSSTKSRWFKQVAVATATSLSGSNLTQNAVRKRSSNASLTNYEICNAYVSSFHTLYFIRF